MHQNASNHIESKLSTGEKTTINGGRSNRVQPLESTSNQAKFKSSNDNECTFTIDDAVEYFGIGKFQIVISLFAGLSWTADAMEMMILSFLSPELHCLWNINEFEQAMITICVFAGMVLPSTLWGNFCDKYGRRKGLFCIALSTFIVGLLSAVAWNFYIFIALRALTGVGIGGLPQSVTYYSEFLPIAHRAKCVVLMQVFWAFGGAVESAIGYFVMQGGKNDWRWLLAISSLPLLFSGISCFFVPESARFLVTSHREDEAYQVLEQIARINGKPMLKGRLVQKADDSKQKQKRGSVFDLFRHGFARTSVFLLTVWFIAVFSYYGMVLFTTVMFQTENQCYHMKMNHSNETTSDCYHLTAEDFKGFVVTSFAEFPALFLTAFLLELIGRKNTMALNFAVFTIFTLFLLLCVDRYWITAFLFVARGLSSGAFQSAYVYTPEVYPTTMRAVGLGTASGVGRIGATVTPLVAQVISKHSIQMPIYIYAGFGIVACICSLLLPIETCGRQMKDRHDENEIDDKKTPMSEILNTKVIGTGISAK